MQKILFVCLGNICRSPLAEGIAKNHIQKNNLSFEVDSCGTGDWHEGENPCENSIKVAKQNAIDISSQISRPITKKDFTYYDKIIALDDSNVANLLKMGAPKEKISKLGFYGYQSEDVPDPYFFNGFEGFEKVYEMIEVCVFNLLKS